MNCSRARAARPTQLYLPSSDVPHSCIFDLRSNGGRLSWRLRDAMTLWERRQGISYTDVTSLSALRLSRSKLILLSSLLP